VREDEMFGNESAKKPKVENGNLVFFLLPLRSSIILSTPERGETDLLFRISPTSGGAVRN
jgi:hypothetical protein